MSKWADVPARARFITGMPCRGPQAQSTSWHGMTCNYCHAVSGCLNRAVPSRAWAGRLGISGTSPIDPLLLEICEARWDLSGRTQTALVLDRCVKGGPDGNTPSQETAQGSGWARLTGTDAETAQPLDHILPRLAVSYRRGRWSKPAPALYPCTALAEPFSSTRSRHPATGRRETSRPASRL
jgi:hypothetical protein